MIDHSVLQEFKLPSHIQVIYSDKEKLYNVLADFINAGLEHDQLCFIGQTVIDLEMFEAFTKKIKNFDEHLTKGNLIFSIFGSYYRNLIDGDMSPFESLKKNLEHTVSNRKVKYIRFIGDLANLLYDENKYEECQTLETWWQEKPFDGCYICPYDSKKLEETPTQKTLMSSLHEDIIYC